jgi:hypothetical protein
MAMATDFIAARFAGKTAENDCGGLARAGK